MNKLFLNLIALLLICGMSSCVKDKFDEPPVGGKDPDIAVNMTLAELKSRYTGQNYLINEDLVISAIVTADDKSGNFYKQIIVQDSTAGITLLLDGSFLYTSYPIGRRIFIKLKGMYLVSYRGLIQLAAAIGPDGSFNGIPTAKFDTYILKGSYGHTVTPKVVTFGQLDETCQSQLIQLNDVEFQSVDAGETYADAENKYSFSRVVKDCDGNSLETYNSGYSRFASERTPTGNGKLVAIYSVYNDDGQLLLRDPSDLEMNNPRCGSNVVAANIASIRSQYTGSAVTLSDGIYLEGVVISDPSGENTYYKAAVIQDSTAGITVVFSDEPGLKAGDRVVVDVSGYQMEPFNNGTLQISGVPVGNITKLGTTTLTPRITTVAEIIAHADEWESILVKVTGVTISGSGSTYKGTKKLNQGSDVLDLYTQNAATFANSNYPTGTVSVTGFISTFNGNPQLQIRNTSDVQ